MRRTPVADTGSRMQRQQEFTPTAPNRLLSDEAMQYVDGVAPMQAKYAANATYNGEAAKRLGSAP